MSEEVRLEGYALCLAQTDKSFNKKVISTYVTCPALYTPDWQKDGGFMHDEGWFDYDINEAVPADNTIYKVASLDGKFEEGKGTITAIYQFLEWDLNEE